jgi:hypothetical protein
MLAEEPECGLTVIRMLETIGDLSGLTTPSLFIARVGQAFSTTYGAMRMGRLDLSGTALGSAPISATNATTTIVATAALASPPEGADGWWMVIEDVERDGYCFSDGVGTISIALMQAFVEKGILDVIPSALQVRFGGFKGMVSLDTRLKGRLLCLRRSQGKFPSDHCEVSETHIAANP